MELTLKKVPEGYKVIVTRSVPQEEEQVFASLDEAVAKIRELEAIPAV